MDIGAGQRWIVLDPSFKLKAYAANLDIPILPFDRMKFFSKVTPYLASELYESQVRDYLKTNAPGKGLSDLPYQGTIIPDTSAALPLTIPYFATAGWPAPEADRKYHHRLTLELADSNGKALLPKQDWSLPEMSVRTITLSFAPAGAS